MKEKEQTLLILSIFSLGVIIILLVFRTFQKNKLGEQSKLIQEQKILIQKTELTRKQKEISTTKLKAIHKTEVIGEISESLKQLNSDFELPTNFINGIQNLIQKENNIDNIWIEFEKVFNEIHPSFITELRQTYPVLTVLDIRHCCYIKMQMTTNEIASFMNIAKPSVQMARVRLKKKMVLDKNASLQSIICSFPKTFES